MSPRLRTTLVQIGSFILAGVLLYFALRGVEFRVIGSAIKEADYTWLIPLVFIILFAHWLRAWRWILLLEALPTQPSSRSKPQLSTKTAFYSVMIGYMVNYAAPRLGEIARSANMAARERLRFSSVLGTVVVERILDVLVLFISLVSVGVLFLDRFGIIKRLFIDPIASWLGAIPFIAMVGLGVLVAVLILLVYRQFLTHDSMLKQLWTKHIDPVLESFKDGLLTLLRAKRRPGIAVSTFLIWFCYLLAAYLPLVMLNMTETYSLSLVDAWGIMILGAVGVVIPSPGGAGSYHYITRQTLVHLFGVAVAPAATYAVLTHGAQMLLYILTGFICLMLQGTSIRSLRNNTITAQQHQSEEEFGKDDETPVPAAPLSR